MCRICHIRSESPFPCKGHGGEKSIVAPIAFTSGTGLQWATRGRHFRIRAAATPANLPRLQIAAGLAPPLFVDDIGEGDAADWSEMPIG
jgi:hypothetical protein